MPLSKIVTDDQWADLLDNALRNLRMEILTKIAECDDDEVDKLRAEYRVISKVEMAVRRELNDV